MPLALRRTLRRRPDGIVGNASRQHVSPGTPIWRPSPLRGRVVQPSSKAPETTGYPMRLARLAALATLAFALTAPLGGEAQQPGKVYRIGLLGGSPPTSS